MVKSLAQNLLDPTPSETSLYWRLSRAEPILYLSIDPDSGAGSDLAIPLSEENAQRIHERHHLKPGGQYSGQRP